MSRADRLLRRARAAERAYRFHDAFRAFLQAADAPLPGTLPDAMMKAARALQMSETWRAQAGVWESMGNRVGELMHNDALAFVTVNGSNLYRYPPGRGVVGRFYVISDREWDAINPPCPGHCRSRCRERQKQAYAYEWAAEGAMASANHADAARLFRRAGWAWEKVLHYKPAASPGADPATPPIGALQRATRCYAAAASNAIRAGRTETRSKVLAEWCPACLPDKQRERTCDHSAVIENGTGPEDEPAGDLSRLMRCWRRIVDLKAENDGVEEALREGDLQLAGIQGLLAGQGQSDAARTVYRARKAFHRHCSRRTNRPRWLLSHLGNLLARDGTSVRRLLLTLTLGYLVLAPALWWAFWAISHKPPLPRSRLPWDAEAREAVLYSLSNVVNVSNGHFASVSWLPSLAQTLEAASAYFALGYVLWVAQRSYSV